MDEIDATIADYGEWPEAFDTTRDVDGVVVEFHGDNAGDEVNPAMT